MTLFLTASYRKTLPLSTPFRAQSGDVLPAKLLLNLSESTYEEDLDMLTWKRSTRDLGAHHPRQTLITNIASLLTPFRIFPLALPPSDAICPIQPSSRRSASDSASSSSLSSHRPNTAQGHHLISPLDLALQVAPCYRRRQCRLGAW